MSQPKAVICAVARTPIGKFMGAFSSMTAVDLGARTVPNCSTEPALRQHQDWLTRSFWQVLQAGAGQNPPAKLPSAQAFLPTPVDRQQGLWVFAQGSHDGCKQHQGR